MTLYRYRAAIHRRIPIEPADDPALLESITVHARDATSARLAIAHVTGARVVGEVERLGEVPAPDGAASRLAAGVQAGNGGCVVFA